MKRRGISDKRRFVACVWLHYRREGRHDLPWRQTRDPYRILVSEVMLQQTPVDRVSVKYKEFLRMFPTLSSLAQASLGSVLRAWQGLGYNRRAKYLHETARILSAKGKIFPRTVRELGCLPGIGSYTARAICTFAFDAPEIFIETNIRAAYLHHFFYNRKSVDDREILPLIEKTLSKKRVREWYFALMDYGSFIKKHFRNPNVRSRSYTKQPPFRGSDREIRGVILRELSEGSRRKEELCELSPQTPERVERLLTSLKKEGMLLEQKGRYALPKK